MSKRVKKKSGFKAIKKKSSFKTGDAVRTNERYARVIGNAVPHEGTLVKQTGWQADVWLVNMPLFTRPQRIHESMLEKVQ